MTLASELGVKFLFLSMISTCRQRRGGSIVPILSLYIAYSFLYNICLQVIKLYSYKSLCSFRA